ncbi:cytochrome c [Lutimaribacter sp. EGI FJ00015]|uniref:Cytochrome c n=1 Tax=Lutimaribacter degradans TaxID=2945989 RepID=A0ACC5ZZV1_9RHOB|nr:cytochrome c [Lutimaribacter sp. EGI FJ00013]MCM2563837.1 cytochrome c [Lutimaribacter sp. EGI FJ00013]MCO0615008.1 cytochrome c [Lutimaribacter sp. EGI FJ00015]MCO0637672.1 cytochrome c [Lutimaribacter sp. EGI FJ00014]
MLRAIAGFCLGGAVLAACAVAEMPEPPEGQALFMENCALCHGADGRGGGEIADGMQPAPSDLTRISARNGGTFPRAQVLSQIDGYTRMDRTEEMPEFGLLLRGDTVPVDVGDGQLTPVPRPLAAVALYLESIQR